MVEADRRAESETSPYSEEPANLNRAPRPRVVVDNTSNKGTRRKGDPIMYKGHILRYKTPAEWEEFGRYNRHIPQEFWDSPIISKRADRQARREIRKRERQERAEERQGNKMPYGITAKDSRDFAQARTEKSLEKRRLTAQEKKQARLREKQLRTQMRASQTAIANQAQTIIGPQQIAGKAVSSIVGGIAAGMSSIIVCGWFPFQLLLGGGALVFVAMGALAAGTSSSLFEWLERIGADGLSNALAGTFGGFIAVGVAFYLFMVTISLILLFVIRSLMKIESLVSMGVAANLNRRPTRIWFYLAIFGCLVPLFILTLVWVNSLRRNPG